MYWHVLRILPLVLVLNSCTVAPPEEAPRQVPAAVTASFPRDLRGAQLYQIDAHASSVHILVYRGGTLARMGHNHVISTATFSGYIWRGSTPDRSGFDIVVPVHDLIVDDDAARKVEGPDFPLNLSEAAKQGTKTNMLSAALLDGAQFPAITIQSIAITGAVDAPQVKAVLQIKHQSRAVTLPVIVATRDEQLQVRGEFKLLQSDFGITPFSAAMGALVVLDSVTIRFDLRARRVDA